MSSEILVEVRRGGIVESIHRGSLIIVDGDGRTVASLGDPDTVTFWRSSAKPFQTIPFLMSGAAERFGFLENEIALACGSHSGEQGHTKTARRMLEKSGFSETDLRCGAHVPFDEKSADDLIRAGEKPSALHNNCSGKHAAMLALARLINSDLQTYEQAENPVQQAILQIVSQFANVPADEIKIAMDGCALPSYALPLSRMAAAYVKLVFPPADFNNELRESCRRIVSAMMSYPEMIGGTKRLDTLLMRALRGRLVSKIGAEGVYCAGVLPSSKWKRGLGIAFKIEDGDDQRARAVVIIELLRRLGVLDEPAAKALNEFSPLLIKNRRGEPVGAVTASFSLNLSH